MKNYRNIWKKAGKRAIVFLSVAALLVPLGLSVIVDPPKAKEAEAAGEFIGGHIKDFTVGAVENYLMEGLSWAADKTGDEGLQEIYKMLSIATGGSGVDQVLKYCQEIMDSLGKIQQEIGAVDTHLTKLIDEYQRRAIQLEISSSYKAMVDPVVECDRIINAYNAYIASAEAYAKAQQDGSSAEEVEKKRQAAEQSAATLTSQFIRVGDNITDPKEIGQIGTGKYEKKLEALASAACTNAISYLPDTQGAFHQIKGATFTGLLYEGYSLSYNAFDHQHREAVETGVNASVSVFVKILMAYRIQLDYVRAENKDLVNQGVIEQKEADRRMEIYDLKYADYVNAVVNAVNDIAGMYQEELAGLMHSYDLNVPYDVLPYDAVQEQKVTWWFPGVEWGEQYAASHTENYIPQPSGLFKFEESYKDFFYRANVGKVSYLISRQYEPCHMSPASFIHKDYKGGIVKPYDFKFRGRDFYNFAATRDGSYRMINDAQELTELFSTSAWSHATNGFISYLSDSGQLPDIDTGASYIIMNKLYKEQPPNMYHDNKYYDGEGTNKTKFHQKMWYLKTGFSYQTGPQEYLYSSGSTDSTSKVMLIMKENKEAQPDYGITTNAVNVLDGQSVDKQQIQVNHSRALPGERLQITITPNEGWTLDSLTISEDGELRDTLCGPETFSYIKDETDSFTFLYDMPYGNVTLKASFKVEEGGNLDGNGTPENPYLITDVEDYLTAVQMIEGYTPSAKAHYKVVNDIDFSSLQGTERTEIEAYFGGVWDGGGHKFINLGPRNHASTHPWMLRLAQEGVVKNLTFENNRFINLVTTNYGTIDNCANIGESQGGFEGLTYENTGKIINCYNTASIIDSSSEVGAVTHNNNEGGIVANCWNRGDFRSLPSNCQAGGLVAYNEGRLYNCYNTGRPDDASHILFGPLMFDEVSDEQGTTVENSFYPDSLKQWSKLPMQHYSVGTMLADDKMRSDDGLVKKLNEGVGKAKAEGLELRYWSRSDGVNDGYPVFADIGAEHSITVESEYGPAELSFMDGTKAGGTVPARMPLVLTVTPDKNREIEKITLLNSSGGELADIPVTDRTQDVFKTQLVMPDEDCILRVDYYQFLKEQDAYLIGDYPALLSAARAVNSSDHFAAADFRLTADIKGNNQEWPVPIGSGREYSGTFDGAGFSIARLWFDQDQVNGGIFDTIGEKGTVKNLGVFGFTVKSNLDAGGIAAFNKGTIDNCYSGTAQLGEGSYIDADGEHSLSELNSSVTAQKYAGGIAARSSGTIINSRSGSDVYGAQHAGGIAGDISGHIEKGHGIFNSYVMGSISSDSTAGGIAGSSRVGIKNTYFAGSFKKNASGHDAPFMGSIVGERSSEILKNCYFLDATAPPDNPAQHILGMEPVTEKEMRSRTFADTLNTGVTEPGYDYWTQKDSQRRGYPYLTHNAYVEQTYTDPATGISVSGTIHAGAVLTVKKLGTGDKGYQILKEYVGGQKLKGVYDISFKIQGRDKDKKSFKDGLFLYFPMDSKEAVSQQWVVHYNGKELHVHKDTTLQDGKLAVKTETLKTFGIIARKDADESAWNSDIKKIKTGDEASILLFFIMAGAGVFAAATAVYYKKRTR